MLSLAYYAFYYAGIFDEDLKPVLKNGNKTYETICPTLSTLQLDLSHESIEYNYGGHMM